MKLNEQRKKSLRYSTIIPSELYVRREADRQLRQILDDMGRPGYVLVARQMGKTNLLLNAKSELQREECVFVYIDLSNPFSTVTECFRNIIDTAIDSHEQMFGHLRVKIQQRRLAQTTLAHKEHDYELRTLLSCVKEKLVIALDEIDALTKASFSDQVFAQIRSTYFAGRTNYPEFHKLTYVLSGVAEPTEIIKNPKLSPFNIGQKIYLDDFSFNEFSQFLSKASLSLPEETAQRIFWWAEGNPRITWEICSAIEDLLISNESVQPSMVDKVVAKVYLECFDRPPVDHIRDLVRKDKELRNALTEIRYGKGREISDLVRTRLYLSGIVRYSNTGEARIKNRVISQALSEEWLLSTEKEASGVYSVAKERFRQNRYPESISLFEEYLATASPTANDRNLTYSLLGKAYYLTNQYEQAIHYLLLCRFDVNKLSELELALDVKDCLARSYILSGNADEAFAVLDEIIEQSKTRRDTMYYQASFARSSILINKGSDVRLELGDLLKELEVPTATLTKDFTDEIRIAILYNLFLANRTHRNREAAVSCIEQAVELGRHVQPSSVPFLILEQSAITPDLEEQKRLLVKASDIVLSNNLKFSINYLEQQGTASLGFGEATFCRLVSFAFVTQMTELFEQLRSYASTLNEEWNSSFKLLYRVAMLSTSPDIGVKILTALCLGQIQTDVRDAELLDAHRQLLLRIQSNPDFISVFESYFRLFRILSAGNSISDIDIHILTIAAVKMHSAGRASDIDAIMATVDAHRGILGESVESSSFLLLDFLRFISHGNRADRVQEYILAEKVLRSIKFAQSGSHVVAIPGINDSEIPEFLMAMEGRVKSRYLSLKTHPKVTQVVPVSKKYGRNDLVTVKYSNGEIRPNVKFKKIEDDLLKGKCQLV